jgi:hypothetical protein
MVNDDHVVYGMVDRMSLLHPRMQNEDCVDQRFRAGQPNTQTVVNFQNLKFWKF